MCVYVCEYVLVMAGACAHVRVCMQKPEVHLEGRSSGQLSTLFCETAFLTGLDLTDSARLAGQ